jgi:hypothetical protein
MKILLLILILFPSFLFAQTAKYDNYDWSKKLENYQFSEQDLQKDEVIVFEKRCIEYINVNEQLKQYVLFHNLKRLNSDAAIEENNKFYVSADSDSKTIILKARVTKPNGQIIEVSKADIKQALDEDGNVKYNYFAFEGIEKGSLIEYLQYTEVVPDFSGNSMRVQSSYDKKRVEVEIIYPSYLEFQLLSVNELPNLELDDSDTLKTRMHLTLNDFKGLESEDWSAYEANLKKVYYKLSKNLARNKGNFYTYTEVSKIVHQNMFTPLTKKEQKLVSTFISKSSGDAKTNIDKLRNLENEMKKKITILDAQFENSSNIEQILTKNVADERGITRLMLNCLREMGLPFELVLTSDRLEEPFLEEFQGYNFLTDYLIYIKEADTYFSGDFFSRIGFPPFELLYNKGLFISEVTVNDYATAIGKVKYIKGIDYKQSIDQIDTEVDFNDDLSSCTVQLTRVNTGYKAKTYQPIIDFLDDEQKKEMKDDFLKYLDKDCTLEDVSFENDNTDSFGVKPFIGKAKVISSTFTERAGDKILLKAGLLIGPQAQMYHEKPRAQAVDSYYTRGYNRKIVINLPDNYEVKNLDDLKFSCKPDPSKNTLGFESTYQVVGNQIIVSVTEWYDTHYFALSDYPNYEKTMNTAADFNKVVLVLQPK